MASVPVSPYARELAVVSALVERAGALLLAEARLARPRGPSASKLTVDVKIERELVQGLLAEFPGDGVCAEEQSSQSGTSGRRWVIDPHDGTSDFSAGARETSISVALQDRGELVLGVVHVPCVSLVAEPELRALLGDAPLSVTWAQGEPLRRNGAPVESRAIPPTLLPGAVALASRKVRAGKLEQNQAALAPARVVPCASIATRLALAACGAVDVAYTARNWLADWDYLGGQALLRGAGGVLLDGRGAPVGPRHDGSAYVGSRSAPLAALAVERLREHLLDRPRGRTPSGPAARG